MKEKLNCSEEEKNEINEKVKIISELLAKTILSLEQSEAKLNQTLIDNERMKIELDELETRLVEALAAQKEFEAFKANFI